MTTRELLKTTTPEEKKLIAEALNKARANKPKEETQTGNKNPSVSFHNVGDILIINQEAYILFLKPCSNGFKNWEIPNLKKLKGGKV